MEGSEGVPLRFPRPAMVGVAIGLASASILLGSAPAFADSVRQHEWWLGKLGVTSAWQTSRGSGVTVAVLSDGVEPANPDLAGAVTAGPDFTRSGRTASGPYFGLLGTAIASLIAGHGHGTDASEGIIGVAPAAKILSVRVTLSPGDPLLTSTTVTARVPGAIAAGIRYAVRHGASVIDLPIDPGQPGAGGTGGISAIAGGSPAEQAAVSYARRKGVVLLAPAGDNGAGPDAVNYPAAYPGVISAGAFDRRLVKAAYSSRQSYVMLTAPGDGVVAATAAGSYATMSSTSAASAIVAGIATLVRSKFPVLSPALVRRALIRSTLFRRPGGIQSGSGYGTANAARALAKASVIAAPLSRGATASPTASPSPLAPTPPAVRSAASSLVSKVLKAVVISASVLILLLLPITIYAAVGRRRARKAAEARWERAQADEAGQAGTTAAPDRPDPMLEFFSPAARPPAPRPASPPAARPPRRAEGISSEDVPFLPSPDRTTGARRPATPQVPSAAGDLDDFTDASGFPAVSDPFRATGAAGAAGDPFRASGDPFRPAREPFGSAEARREPPRPAGGPVRAAGDPFEAAGDPFGPARDPFVAAAHDPVIGAADRPGPAGRSKAGSHSRTGSPAGPRPAARQPRSSATPPWEPAAKPDSDLPWANGPAPHRAYPAPVQPTHPARAAHRRMPRPVAPSAAAGPGWPDAQPAGPTAPAPAAAGSIWDAAARPARRPEARGGGGPGDSRQGPAGGTSPGSSDTGATGSGSSGPGSGEDSGTGPIYVWNPGASTDTFPSVPANRDPSRSPGQDPSGSPGQDPSGSPGQDPSGSPGQDPSGPPSRDPSVPAEGDTT